MVLRRVARLATAAALVTCSVVAQEAPPAPPTLPMPVPRSVAIHRGDARIYVDGSLEDWPGVPALLLNDTRQLSGTAMAAWRGPSDLLGKAFLLWDEEDLFFAAVVSDDWHRPLKEVDPRTGDTPPADHIMLTFDPRRDTRGIGPDPGRAEDREFWLADVTELGRKLVMRDRLRGTGRFAVKAVAVSAHDREKGRTAYEARIPWREILPVGMEAVDGLVFDLQVVLNDFDAITDSMPQTRIGWTFGAGATIDPGVMGSIMLVQRIDEDAETLPAFPEPPEPSESRPGAEYWVDLWSELMVTTPVAVHGDSEAPQVVLGRQRLALLEQLERHAAEFPRLDFTEFHARIHRRMRRECAGILARGLPSLWQHALIEVGQRASQPAPEKGFRLFRLPGGGWLVRSNAGSFGIDPAGYGLEYHIWGALDCILLTDPGEITKRNDQILLRMYSAKRSFYTHRSFHLPGMDSAEMPLVDLGKRYGFGELAVTAVGVTKTDLVSPTAAYVVQWPDGTILVHSGRSVSPELLAASLPAGRRPDVLILSAKHRGAPQIARTMGAALIVLDDVLQCSTEFGAAGRVPLEDVFALQTAIRPHASMILAPGESLDIARRE